MGMINQLHCPLDCTLGIEMEIAMQQELENKLHKEILVIDDDDVMREKFRRILRTTPYQMQEATCGKEATKLLENNEYDCVLLDNRLGDANGVDLMPVILNLLKKPCPIIMITGTGDERLIVEAMRSGVYDYINKNELNVQHLSAVIAAGLRWAELEQKLRESHKKIEYLSMYDELTNMPNRHLFFDRLDQARLFSIRQDTSFAILMMDLNLFKEVNDTFGHAAGDDLLKQVGQRIKDLTRNTDTVARLGGDEFAGIINDVSTHEEVLTVVNKILDAVGAPFMIEGQMVSIGISIGIAFFPSTDIDAQSLLAKADSAMYLAKTSSRSFEFYDEKVNAKQHSTLMSISGHIGAALKNKEFTLMYQPQINLIDGSCCGVEALARWKSPILGSVSPTEFIHVAERSSVIVEMSYILFDMAIMQAAEWYHLGLKIPVSVNMSVKMLDTENLVINIMQLLVRHNLPPELLTIEITETALLSNPANAAIIINELSETGIQISIDDFGTGYTSFKYLRQFMFNELKIDQLFVSFLEKNTRDASIIKSFISLSEGFKITLIAEGVEDLDRLLLLKEMGCARAQGYFISRPMNGDALPGWLITWQASIGDTFTVNRPH
jgi:diguanylate cyclase